MRPEIGERGDAGATFTNLRQDATPVINDFINGRNARVTRRMKRL